MFERLLLRSFQRHEVLEVKLDPNVTTFIGPNNSGKSTVRRALEWLCLNRQPSNYRGKHGHARSALVRLWVDRTHTSRFRSEGDNYYQIALDDPLRAFGTHVPRNVADLLNVSDVNFQGQLDGPYWFLLTAAEVSRRLNGIINLDVIDQMLSDAAKEVRRADAAVDVSRERLETSKERRDALAWVRDFDAKLAIAEELYERSVVVELNRSRIVASVAKAREAAERVRRAGRAIVATASAVKLARRGLELAGRIGRLRSAVQKARKLERLSTVSLPPIGRLLDRRRGLTERIGRLASALANAQQLRYVVQQSDLFIDDTRDQLERMGDTCPTCGQTVLRP